ncbi:MAG: hypothetical protein LBT56_06010 [Prevotellaceae bacterium]|jgi:hypothetical protein|nr:hypothetical protein [Prevotellaceae bacterium]
MLRFIRKIFERIGCKEKKDDNEWINSLFENIQNAIIKNSIIPFKIVSIKKTGFLVKTGGLFALIHFKKMPWQYINLEYWQAISSTLTDKIFYCSVLKAIKTDTKSIIIIIDGRVHKFRTKELIENTQYSGVIIYKSKYGLFIDIGYHFEWKYGSFIGLLHRSRIEPDLFQNYEQGQIIDVIYTGMYESKLAFDSPNLNKYLPEQFEYKDTDKIVEIHVNRAENGNLKFLIDGKYKAYQINTMPEQISKKEIKAAINNLADGDIIIGEILEFSEKYKSFQFKWIDFENKMINELNECEKYLGKTVDIQVSKNENGILKFIIDGKYKATLLNKLPEHILKEMKETMKDLEDKDVILGEILEYKKGNNSFLFKWIDFENKKLNKCKQYLGKTVEINVNKKENGKLKFMIDGKYNATLVNEPPQYIPKQEMKTAMKNLADEEIILGEILEFQEKDKHFLFRWLNIPIRAELTDILLKHLEYVGKTVQIRVYKIENGYFVYKIKENDKTEELLNKLTVFYSIIEEQVEKANEELLNGDIINAEIINFDANNRTFLFKWITTDIPKEESSTNAVSKKFNTKSIASNIDETTLNKLKTISTKTI